MIDKKTMVLNMVYRFVQERHPIYKAAFDSDESFYTVLNGMKDDRKVAIEMIAFLHAEQLDAKTIIDTLDDNMIVKIGNGRFIYDGHLLEYRRAAVRALAQLVLLSFNKVSNDKINELIQLQFSHKAIHAIQEAMQ